MSFFPATQVVRENRKWIALSAAIFGLGFFAVFTGIDIPGESQAAVVSDNMFSQLEQMIEIILNSHPVVGVMLIFVNNVISSFQMLFLGVIIGLSPVFTLLVNGALLGIISAQVIGEGISAWYLVLGILPHGIPELFAVFLCAAMGLKLGVHAVISPIPGKTRLQSFKFIWKEIISVIPLVVILLLVAAAIEIFVTQALVNYIIN